MTGQLTFTLLYQKPDKSLAILGRSHPVGSTAHSSRFTQRLKLEDEEDQLAEDVDLQSAILRLRFPPSSIHLVDELIDHGHLGDRPLCHSFSMSIRAELRSGVNENGEDPTGPSRLLRVRWEGTEATAGLFDYSQRVTAVLEFDRSMKEAFKIMKTTPFASLHSVYAVNSQLPQQSSQPSADPVAVRLSQSDPSTLLLDFPGGSLARGFCHALQFLSLTPVGGPDFDTKHLGQEAEICTSGCLCHWPGTERCNEFNRQCKCKFPYVGADCSKCQEGYTLDPSTGECTVASKCAELGGSETCSGHG